MAEFSTADLPNFSISHDLFSDITPDERFPTLPEEELENLAKTKIRIPPRYKNLAESFQRLESAT